MLLTAAALALALVAAGCAAPARPGDAFGNLAYRGVYERAVTLRDGRFEGEPFVSGGASRPRVELEPEPRASGDLDGDGLDETALLLTESSGGTGVNTYLAIVSRRGGRALNVATRLIGDRVQIRSLGIRDRAVVIEYIGAGPADPRCCPTAVMRRIYRLEGDARVEVDSEVLGRASLKDLEGITWTLSRQAETRSCPRAPA